MALMKQDICATVQLDADAEKRDFRLDTSADATRHHLSILTNMYTRPELAVVRETLQNAFDADPSKKVRVTLPDEFTYEFSVKDDGCGMTAEELDRNVGTAGLSTKTGKANQAGEFGIGTLCPMTYTDSFAITSWKDGLKATMTAFKKDDGSLGYTVSPSTPSKNSSGTLVTVPVHRSRADIEKFEEALDAFRFSPKLAARINVPGRGFSAHPQLNRREVKVGDHTVSFWSVAEQSPLFGQVVILVNDIPVAANLDRFPALKEFSETMFTDGGSSDTTLVIAFPAEAGIAVPPNRETVAVTRINTALIANACAKYLETLTASLEAGLPTPDCGPAAKAVWQKLALQAGGRLESAKAAADARLQKLLEPAGLFASLTIQQRYGHLKPQPVTDINYLLADERPGLLTWITEWNRGVREPKARVELLSQPSRWSDLPRWKQAKNERAGVLPCTTKLSRIVVWPSAKDDWANAYLRKLVVAWLYDIASAPGAPDLWTHQLLLVGTAPDPDSALAKSGIEVVDFEDWQKNHVLADDNPFVKKAADRVIDRTAKARRQFGPLGWTNQEELPKAGFAYARLMRGRLDPDQFQKAYTPDVWGYGDGSVQLTSWLRWFEASGAAPAVTVTCLTDGDADGIKRRHIHMEEVLTSHMDEFAAGLDGDEADWFPRAWFAAALEEKAPKLLVFLRSLDASGYAKNDPDFEPVLAATRPPPSTKMARMLAACRAELKDETDISWRFRGFTECQDLDPIEKPDGLFHGKSFYGIPCATLAQAAFALKRLSLRDDPLAVWFRVVWYAHMLKEGATLIGQVNWFLPLPDADLAGPSSTAMAIPHALAK